MDLCSAKVHIQFPIKVAAQHFISFCTYLAFSFILFIFSFYSVFFLMRQKFLMSTILEAYFSYLFLQIQEYTPEKPYISST